MSIGKQKGLQGTLYLLYDQLPKSKGHAFYQGVEKVQSDFFKEV